MAWTDVIQVIFLILGGLVTTYLAVNSVSDGNGFLMGMKNMYKAAPEKFAMILEPSNPEYKNLPGIGVLVGGMWVANLYYWGFNQYIIQRTLAAKSLKESQKGILLAAGLKLILPIIVVIPGIAAYIMIKDTAMFDSFKPDNAYPWLLQLLPSGLKGLAFAALTAAIVSSLASMLNSTSTIFTMDIYKQYIRPNANDKETVNTGRISAAVALLVAGIMARYWAVLIKHFNLFKNTQVLLRYFSSFCARFILEKTTNKGAIIGTLSSIPIAMYFKVAPKGWSNNSFFLNDIPFLDQMGYTALITMVVIVIASHVQNRGKKDIKGIEISKETFKTSTLFNVISFAIMLILTALYAIFWK